MNKHRFFWLFSVLLLLTSRSPGQSIQQPYHLQVLQGQSLQEAVEHLARDYQLDFGYAPEVLAHQSLDQAQFSAPDIESLLRQLLADQPVQYRILSDNRILLRGITLKSEAATASSLSLSGRITDASTGQPMMNVAIALDTLNLGTLSDEKGAFALQLPAVLQRHSVWIYHIGYKSQQVPVAGFKTGQVIHLEAEPLSLNEVLIVGHLPTLSFAPGDGSIRLHGEGIEGNAAAQLAGKDIFREVQLLPGVSAHDDLSSDIKIRGSNADETLIILDGMPLYKVDHFYGIFSALNSSYLQEAQLYKNALPIQYGGRTGGMLLLRSTDEIKKFSGALDLNLLSAALKVNMPISPTLGLSLSGRGSHLNVATSKFFNWVGNNVENYTDISTLSSRPDILPTDPNFGFSDWNAKLVFNPSTKHHFAANFFRSNDHYLNSYSNSFSSRFNQERVSNEENFRDQQDWQNTGASLQYRGQLPNKWKLEADAFYSSYQFTGTLDATITRTSMRLGSNSIDLKNDQLNAVENTGYRLLLNKELGTDQALQFGSSLSHYNTDFFINSEVDTLLASQGQSFDAQLFSNYQWSPLEHLQLALGGRVNYYRETGKFYFSPRITGNYRFDSGWSLKSSYSINYQFIREITHENRLGQSVDLAVLSDDQRFPVGQSTNFMLGTRYQTDHWWLDLELFHKKLSNVIDHSSIDPTFDGQAVRPGQRQNYRLFIGDGVVDGLDLALGLNYQRYSGQLAYTLSKATNHFPQIQTGAAVPARDDRRHQLKWINTYQLGRFELSGNFIYSSGKPYYDLRIIPQGQGDRRKEFVRWLPSYQRLDLGVAYHFKIASTQAELGASVFNVTNNANVKYLQFIYSLSSEENNQPVNTIIGSQTDLLDRTLNLSFGLVF